MRTTMQWYTIKQKKPREWQTGLFRDQFGEISYGRVEWAGMHFTCPWNFLGEMLVCKLVDKRSTLDWMLDIKDITVWLPLGRIKEDCRISLWSFGNMIDPLTESKFKVTSKILEQVILNRY